MELVPRDHRWPGLRKFAALTGLLFLATSVAMLFVLATAEHDLRSVDIALLIGSLVGLPLLLVIAAHRLAAPGSLRAVAGVGFVAPLVMLLLTMTPFGVLSGPRILLGGGARGTLADVAATRAGWAEVSPARVWSERRGYGVYTSTKDGRTTTTSVWAAPLVPTIPWDGEASLFICDDEHDLAAADPGTGTIAGILSPASDLAGTAVRMLADKGLLVGPNPRCLYPTFGGYTTTFVLHALYSLLAALLMSFTAAWGAVRAALGR